MQNEGKEKIIKVTQAIIVFMNISLLTDCFCAEFFTFNAAKTNQAMEKLM